jgi:bifunctional non-homologous end joining protein LigD
VAIGVKAPYPGFVEPALATPVDKVPSDERWIHEIKFDGYRVQVHLKDAVVKSSHDAATTGPTAFGRSRPTLGASTLGPQSSTARSSCRPPMARPSFPFGSNVRL